MITRTGFKRLYKLADYMESLPKSANKHFNMANYIDHNTNDHDHLLSEKPTVKDLHTCGTTACALGWAMTVPSFRRAGLRMEVDRVWGVDIEGSVEVFGLDQGWDEPDYWEELFGGDNADKTPKAWAKRARKLLEKWEAIAATKQ